MKPIYLLLIFIAMVSHAEILRGTFQYTVNSDFTSGLPPLENESTAFFIFDTETQSLKIFNFMEDFISSDIFSHDFHLYEVSRHSGSDPITTIGDLTDFSVSKWTHYAETEIYPDVPYEVTVETDFDGYFSHYETPILGQAVSTAGEIISFHLDEIENQEKWSFEIESDVTWFRLKTTVGYKYQVFQGDSLSDMSLMDASGWNQSSDGMIIGSGDDWFYVDREENSRYFMKATGYPIEITD